MKILVKITDEFTVAREAKEDITARHREGRSISVQVLPNDEEEKENWEEFDEVEKAHAFIDEEFAPTTSGGG